jgi:hypothetical protein
MIACSAGTANPLLGQSSRVEACIACTGTEFTSNEGEAECTVPLVDIACLDNTVGKEYDAASQTCVACPAGTFRPVGVSDSLSCVAW